MVAKSVSKREKKEYLLGWQRNNREKTREYNRKYYQENKTQIARDAKEKYHKNRAKYLERNFRYESRLKTEVINHYGGKCVSCGESDIIVLTIDHVNGGGQKHMREIRGRLYKWLRDEGYPEDKYQVLCRNCNWRKYIEENRSKRCLRKL